MNIYLLLFLEFFKIGLFTIGGGYAMIPLISETVISHEWMSEDLLHNFIGIAEGTPGPFAVNISTFIGFEQGGLLGATVAVLGLILPSLIIIILIASVLSKFSESTVYKRIFAGIKVIVACLILATGLILSLKSLGFVDIYTLNFDYRLLIVFILLVLIQLLFKFIIKKRLPNVIFILMSAAIGLIVYII